MITDVLKEASKGIDQHLVEMPTIYRDEGIRLDLTCLRDTMQKVCRRLAKVEPPAEQRESPEPDYPTREAALWYFGKLRVEERFMLLSWAVVNAIHPMRKHPRREGITKRLLKLNGMLEAMVERYRLEDALDGTIQHWMVQERRRIWATWHTVTSSVPQKG